MSEEVLQSIAKTLQLDEVETTHLFDLVRAGAGNARKKPARGRAAQQVPESVEVLMDAMIIAPAIVQNGHLYIGLARHLSKRAADSSATS
ncbi:hypothetical protein AB0H34_42880 [Saccharopolyspora shandongensis]|uniref:hypothetical protein n=1 Tax=Saccharopolyspora shandongensis TaxID=418495 RepID=UPI0033EBB77E